MKYFIRRLPSIVSAGLLLSVVSKLSAQEQAKPLAIELGMPFRDNAIPKEGEVEATAVPADYYCGYHVYVRKPQEK